MKERDHAREKNKESKRRWRRKLEGRNYHSDDENYSRNEGNYENYDDNPRSLKKGNEKYQKEPKKNRKYALYWDVADDPRL